MKHNQLGRLFYCSKEKVSGTMIYKRFNELHLIEENHMFLFGGMKYRCSRKAPVISVPVTQIKFLKYICTAINTYKPFKRISSTVDLPQIQHNTKVKRHSAKMPSHLKEEALR